MNRSAARNLQHEAGFVHDVLSQVPVVCIPHAGGGASAFAGWKRLGRGNVVVAPLPSRDAQHGQAPARSIPESAEAVLRFIVDRYPGPIQLFGHSMGGLIAFEVALALQKRQPGMLARLVVSGCRAPDVEDLDRLSGIAGDQEFLAAVAAFGGLPEQLLRDKEFREYVLPILRADLAACESYRRPAMCGVEVPLMVIHGSCDPHVPLPHIRRWAAFARGSCVFHQLVGGHFFPYANPEGMMALILAGANQ